MNYAIKDLNPSQFPRVALAANYSPGTGTGISRYQKEVLDQFVSWLAQSEESATPFVVFPPLNRAGRSPQLPQQLDFAQCRLPGKVQRLLNITIGIPIERLFPSLSHVEVIHSFVPEYLVTHLPWIVTVYDVAWRFFGRKYEAHFPAHMRHSAERAIATADFLLAISQTTADDLVAGGVDAHRVLVAPLGVDPKFSEVSVEAITQVREKYALPEQFIAYVGTFFERKNVVTLIRAVKEIRPESAPPLIMAGPPPKEGLDHWGIDGKKIRHIGYLDEADMPAFYAAAHVLVFPSLYEGFGLPLLEAMAARTPVVASDIKIFREVGGDAFLSFNPHAVDSVSQLRYAIDQVFYQDHLHADLKTAGQHQATLFTWKTCCRSILETYSMAIGKY